MMLETDLLRWARKKGLRNEWSIKLEPLSSRIWALTDFKNNAIVLSSELAADPIDKVRQIVLHEIAQTMCGPTEYHGPLWQEKARALGLEPEYFRHDWAACETPDTIFYVNYIDAQHMCSTDARCTEIARNQVYLYDMNHDSVLPDVGRLTRARTKVLTASFSGGYKNTSSM